VQESNNLFFEKIIQILSQVRQTFRNAARTVADQTWSSGIMPV
jgi:hypothetical protein